MRKHISSHAAFQRETNLRLHHISSRMSTTQPKLLLRGNHIKNLIWVRRRRQPAHHFNHHDAADPVVPCFAQIAVRSIKDHERRIWNDRISRLDSHVTHILGIPGADIEQDHVARKDAHALLLRHYMNVAYAGNGMYGPLRSQNDPSLVDQRWIIDR